MSRTICRPTLVLVFLALIGIVIFAFQAPARAETITAPGAGGVTALSAGSARARNAIDIGGLDVGLTDFELDGNAVTQNLNPGLPDDWDRLFADNGTSHQQIWTGVTQDTNNRTYTSGSKDTDDFPSLSWSFGSVPPKSDIQSSYVALYAGNHVYFGADRLSTSGNTYIGFWLLQNEVTANSNGTFSGHRTVGDVLILANFGGGGVATIGAYRWDGVNNLTPLAIDANKDFAIVNSGTVPSPWPYPIGASAPYNFPAGAFFEGGADLADMGITGCFAYFLTETRSSSSLSAELKNFVLGELPARPIIHVTPQNRTICFGDPAVTFCARVDSGTGAPPFTWAWTGPDGFSSTDTCVTVGGGLAPGLYVYTAVVTGCNFCPSLPISDTLTVVAAPSASIDGPGTVCLLSTNSHCGPAGAVSYSWSISGNGSISGPSNAQCVQVLAGVLCNQSYNLTLTIGNASGCAGTAHKSVLVNDTTAPVITCPSNVTIQCNESIDPGHTGSAIATDNCGGTPTITYSDLRAETACPQAYTITRTWTAKDGCNNAATCAQTINVVDTVPPTIACPAPITIQCDESADPGHTGSATATDNCGGVPAITYSDARTEGSCPQAYIITRTWKATDACSNSSTCTQAITVVDTTPPHFTSVCPSNTSASCSAVPTAPTMTAADNCDTSVEVSFAEQRIEGGCPNAYTLTRTWTAHDNCGNTAQCIQHIDVSDHSAPTFVGPLPGDVTVQCDAVPQPATLTATDNCDPSPQVGFSEHQTTGTCANSYTLTRTWIATDACGNSQTHVQQVTVIDTTNPHFTSVTPPDVTVDCASIPPAATMTAADNCGGDVRISFNEVNDGGPCPNTYQLTRTWTATDACGNSIRVHQHVNVQDVTAPHFTSTCPSGVTVECNQVPLPATMTAADNCDPSPRVTFNETRSNGSCASNYSLLRLWTATDACGNSATCSQTVTVRDRTAPEITCPADIAVDYGDPTDPGHTGSAGATDNCDPSPRITHSDGTRSGPCPQSYLIDRTWVATDACGNSATCLQTITISDTSPPVIACPSDARIECGESTEPGHTGTATGSDDSGIPPVITYSDTVRPGSCPEAYTIARTWRATDQCGSFSTCLQTITVVDDIAPVITCPGNATLECTESTDPNNTGFATATDNCDPSVIPTYTDHVTPGAHPHEAIIARTWTATDDCSNSSTCLQTITVIDGVPPEITCPSDATVECGRSTDPDSTGVATAEDNCDDDVDITYSDRQTTGDCGQEYTITRTWLATDASGNTDTCVQTIAVVDTIPPEITCPDNLTIDVTESLDPSHTGSGTATDDCDATVTITHSDVIITGVCPQTYTIERTWTAEDDCGNSATCMQVISVEDRTSPVMSAPGDVTIACTESTDPSHTGVATATDNSGVPPVVTHNDARIDGTCPQTYVIERTWTATDQCSNVATEVQHINVQDVVPPVISCPSDRTFNCDDVIDFGQATATDNCDTNVVITFSDETIPGANPQTYQIVRTWTATDDCENSASCRQRVTVLDSTPPVITCPSDRRFECDQPIVFGEATATDACSGQVAVTFQDQTIPGSSPQNYQIRRTWTATDASGNSASCVETVTVADATGPVLAAVADSSVFCNQEVVFTQPVATDVCDGNPTVQVVSTTVTPGPGPCQYTHRRCWVAHDASGNSSNQVCQTIVQTVDTTPPVIVCAPNKTIGVNDPVVFDEPQVTDNCPLTPTLQSSPPVVGASPAQETTYTRCWIAFDLCGNSSGECCQTITVSAPVPDTTFCSFTCWNWTAACLEPANRERSTTPACIRDDHFADVFPNGLVIGSHSAPRRYTATWTSAHAVEAFKCGYGLPAALARDYVNPGNGQLPSIYGEILALRLNREFSCRGYLSDLVSPGMVLCFGDAVVPREVPRFAGLTVDQLLSIADQALSGNASVLVPYGSSLLRLQSAAAYMNWLYGNCGSIVRAETPPFMASGTVDQVGDGLASEPVARPAPEAFSVATCPNPLRTSVTISLALPADASVSLDLYDIQGRKVATMARERMMAGYRDVIWNGTDDVGMPVASGVYFLRVQIDGQIMAMQKLMKL